MIATVTQLDQKNTNQQNKLIFASNLFKTIF